MTTEQYPEFKIALVQERWYKDPLEHQAKLEAGIKEAARQGAQLVCLQELSLSPYFCTRADVDPRPFQEDLATGPTARFVSRCARQYQIAVTASLFDHLGYNTAVAFNAAGALTAFTRKQHIPSGEGYHENYYFKPGDSNYPVHHIAGHQVALPTCYDQWFPELSRLYGLKGAEILIYPTAIGSEPTAPDFDSQPLWQKVMVAQGIMSHCFVIAVNRIGHEDKVQFYGSSFISSPTGKILAKAPRNAPAVLVASLDFAERALFQRLFPFYAQRQPESYAELLRPLKETVHGK